MFGRFREPPALDTDLGQADLELRAARDRAVDGDWTAARDLLAATGRDWELRGRRLTVLAAAAARSPMWLDLWESAVPADPAVAILRADALNDQSRTARGAASAQHTSQQQFKEFHRLSGLAAEASRRAVVLNPDDPCPWTIRMTTMFAEGRRQRGEFLQSFGEAVRRDPFNFEAHSTALNFLCEKWFGSHEEMFAAARGPAAAAPPGSSVVMLPLLAHFEYMLRAFWDESWEQSLPAQMAYFRRPEVYQEINDCAVKWCATGTPRMLGRGVTLRLWLALANFLADRDRAGTRVLLREIGPYLGSTVAYGYFWSRQSDGLHAIWKWAG